MNNKFTRWKFLTILGIFLAASLVIFISLQFVEQARRNEMSLASENLVEISLANVASVRQTINEYIEGLKMVAVFVEQFDDFKSPEVMDVLRQIAKDGKFEHLAINYVNGMSYTADGHVIDTMERGHLDKIRNGEVFVENVTGALGDGMPIINVHAPLRDKAGKPVAALCLALMSDTLSNIFNLMFWNEEGYFHLIDGNGRFIATSSQHFMLDELTFEHPFSRENFENGIKNGESNFTKYAVNGGAKYLLYHLPVGINKWTMMVVVPDSVLQRKTDEIVMPATMTTIYLILILFAVFGYIYILQNNSKLRAILNEKCFRALANQSGKTIFEWDFDDGPLISITPEMVHEDDKAVFADVRAAIESGENVKDAKFRVHNPEGDFHWFSFSGVIIKHDNGEPFKAIMTLENIDDEEREREELEFKAMTDPLTKLYNKIATKHIAAESLAHSDKEHLHALFCLDLDGFKELNDKFGHLFGDNVLVEVADKIRLVFRSSDVLGRFGGDEFVLLIKNLPSEIFAQNKARKLVHSIQKTYISGSAAQGLSASVGVAIFPMDGLSYDELHKKADAALYKAKRKGKNRAVFCHDVESGE